MPKPSERIKEAMSDLHFRSIVIDVFDEIFTILDEQEVRLRQLEQERKEGV